MTTAQLLETLLRRWYVVLAGILCTWTACSALMLTPGVYGAHMDVVFVVPGGVASSNDFAFAEPLINFAGVVERKVNDDQQSVRLSSPTAELYGLGVREGVSVALADSGGQWGSIFRSPIIRVQVVASSPEQVVSAVDGVVAKIAMTAKSIQDSSGVAEGKRISIETIPDRAQVFSYVQTRTSDVKATAAASMVGLGLTACAATLLDRWDLSRSQPGKRGRRRVLNV